MKMQKEALERLREAESFIGSPATETIPLFREARLTWLKSVRVILRNNNVEPENLSGPWHTKL